MLDAIKKALENNQKGGEQKKPVKHLTVPQARLMLFFAYVEAGTCFFGMPNTLEWDRLWDHH